ncbi:hypothetical protein [Schaalia cardiffensis]|uniref:hypothetical protein n=1 Tax=Schaalia cardiffensis TaxID=181487 RepID=UPI0013F3C77E|nr:hypothetical protein [Schaalia cardiffensis]
MGVTVLSNMRHLALDLGVFEHRAAKTPLPFEVGKLFKVLNQFGSERTLHEEAA